MLFPAAIYLIFNYGRPGQEGWGIPMATDIAFSLGAIAVFGRKLPVGLRVFLSAFAIADDLGAVFVIALFYTKQIAWQYLLLDIPVLMLVFVANLLWIRWTPLYAVLGLVTWLAILASGVHPTVAGIVIAARRRPVVPHFRGRSPGWDRIHHVPLHFNPVLHRIRTGR